MAAVVAVGSAVLDRVYGLSNLPAPDGGAFVRDYTERAGGVAANVACALAALDHDAAVVSRVGRDDAGDRVRASLAEWGVDATRVRRGDDATSYALVLRGPEGNRMIVAGGGAVPGVALTSSDRDALRAADCVFTSAYAPDSVVRDLVALRRSGAVSALAFDLAGPRAELDGRGAAADTVAAAAATADLFVANAGAADSHVGVGPERAASEFAAMGASRVAVTDGSDGAFLATPATTVHAPARAVDVTDTTGAGDAFTAALVHAWVLGDAGVRDAGRIAAAAAAQNCTREGARGGLACPSDLPD
ncbi:carbohydrate kinase family protein [Halobacterium salinarum]|uniref:PfkB family kinase n=2 Tax=Halobacterium salinarum TaxID=2242 RepID=A0A4D6GQ66_HALS9|nr:carbohydrate kinase family protein [Halobacterium salinarum]MDL0132315.1 carbohydrate kinase family protein [Halobacterium salinarum]QCC43834.1 PfkB family kinase [Halobacterium salinarum]TYO82329.1 ribokinase [Halobacterium salinarum DSM 3754]